MRIVILLTALFMAFGALSLGTSLVAEAQPAPTGQMAPRQPTGPGQGQVREVVVKKSPHSDIVQSSGTGMALLFWLFAAVSVGGALFVVSRKNLIAAVMGMVGSFVGVSAVYMMLYASFLAVIQMLVYAGAIMVLFVFVIMILNRPEDEPIAPTGRAGQAIGGLAILYLVYRLAMLLIHIKLPNEATALMAPEQVQLPPIKPGVPGELVDWGSVKAVGADLFGGGLFAFEAISILLLIAVVGAIALARPLKDDPHAGETPQAGGLP
jgi:NADH-quinone oxidoreductase subunit J